VTVKTVVMYDLKHIQRQLP